MKTFKQIVRILTFAVSMLIYGHSQAQTGVLNPDDPIVIYNPAAPPATPAYGVLSKWVKTNRVSYNTTSFKAYYYKGMAFRLKFPKTYKDSINTGKKYPVFVFFHGVGEKGKVYDNEYQMYHGGQKFMNDVDKGNFDGFLLYPQSSSSSGGFNSTHYQLINELITNYFVPELKVDINRIIVDGLSGGGQATWQMLKTYPTLVAAGLPISAVSIADESSTVVNKLKFTPIWLFQGGLDKAPAPYTARTVVNAFKSGGSNISYTEYPTQGHGCWNSAWADAGFLSFINKAHKANPWPLSGRTEFCPGELISQVVGVTAGFDAYEWRKNGVVIEGAISNSYTVTSIGVYDCRIKRGEEWSVWSPLPVVIKLKGATISPDIQVQAQTSNIIPAPSNVSAQLTVPEGFATYNWQKVGSETVLSTTNTLNATEAGDYKVKVTELYSCSSEFSNSFRVISSNGHNGLTAATGVTAKEISKTEIKLSWNQNANPAVNESGFEIYRSESSSGPFLLISITSADADRFIDSDLNTNSRYYYKVRAINENGASEATEIVDAKTMADNLAPSVPGNLRTLSSSHNSVELIWDDAIDDVEVVGYDIYVNGVKYYESVESHFTVYNLQAGITYTFNVKAKDFAGNQSPFSNQATAQALLNGLSYKYYTYTGSWDKLPDFNTLEPDATGIVPVLTIANRTQSDNFAYLWEGFINIPVAGIYYLRTTSDAGSRVWLGALNQTTGVYSASTTPVVDNDGLHTSKTVTSVAMNLAAGHYPIAIAYYEETASESMNLYWRTPTNSNYVVIPATAFADTPIVNGVAPINPSALVATAVGHDQINITWTDNSSNENGFEVWRAMDSASNFNYIGFANSNSTHYTDTYGLMPGTNYYYQIRAVGEFGESDFVGQYKEANWKFDNNYKDASGNNKLVVPTSGPTFDYSEKREGSHSIKLNGTNHSVLIDPSNGYLKGIYSQKSVAFWMKAASTVGNRVIFDLGGNDDGIAMKLDSNKLYVGIASNNIRKSIIIPFESLDWTHVAVVYDKSSLKLYINGVESGAIENLGFTATTATTNGSRIGLTEGNNSLNSGNARFSGWLDNFTIYSTALTADVVAAHMNNTAGVSNAKTAEFPIAPPAPYNLNAVSKGLNGATLNWVYDSSVTKVDTVSAGSLRVEAESYLYMTGVATETCSEGGLNVKSIDANDWMDYVVNVPVGGVANVSFRVATNNTTTGQFQLRSSDDIILATLNIPKTGSAQVYTTVNTTVNLPAGEQTLRVFALKNGWNFNWLEITTGQQIDTAINTYDVSGFELHRSKGTSNDFEVIGNFGSTVRSYSDSSLLTNTQYSYKVRAITNHRNSEFSTVATMVTSNNSPLLQSIADQTLRFGSTRQIAVAATDLDDDQLILNVYNLPAFAVFTSNGNGGSIMLNPSAVENIGTYNNVTVVAKDLHGGADTIVFSIIVDENHRPVIAPVSAITLSEKTLGTIKLVASDLNETDSLVWSFKNLPAFASYTIEGDSLQISLAPGYADNGTYTFKAYVNDGNNGTDSTSVLITVSDVNPNNAIYVNFGDATFLASEPWNNTSKVPAVNDDFAGLKDNNGVVTTTGIKLLTAWTGVNNQGANTSNNSGVYPDAILKSSYYTSGTRSIKVYGLAAGYKYSFSFFGSRANPTVGVVTNYTIGAETVSLNAANNKFDTAVISNITPDLDGSVVLSISNAAGSTYGYLNGLVIRAEYDDQTVPAKPRDLSAQILNGKVNLSWTDAAYNETAYEVYRSTTKNGSYTLLVNEGNTKDQKSYEDAAISGHTTYYYSVRALNSIGASLYSDTVMVSTPNASPVLAIIDDIQMQTQQTLSVGVTATDEPGDIITLTASGLPAFATFTDNGNGTGVLHLAPGNTSGQFNNITITATDLMHATSSRVFKITVANATISSTYVNFNQTNPAAAPWNNMNLAPTANASIANLKDDAGLNTGMSISLVEAWTAQTATGYTTGNNSGLYPDNAMINSYYYGTANVDRNVRISGLSANKKYNLIFFASRNNYASSLVTRYTVSGQSVELQVANNMSTTVQLNDLTADANGQLLITARGVVGPNVYLGTIIIQAYTPNLSNPVAPANLTATGISKSKIKLQWQSVANNGYEVWKSMSVNGTYSKLADVAANTTTFTDSSLLQATTYYYKVKAVINGVSSPFSNYAGAQTVAYVINLNMNDGTTASPAQGGNWNNTNALIADGYTLSNMINDQGQNTGINFNIVKTFSGFNYTGKVTGDNSGVYPDNVIKSFYYVNYADTARLKVTGLTLGHDYNFVFYGNRQNPVTGVTTAYKIGNQVVTLDATNNTSNTIKITGVKPEADGSVSITIYGTLAGGFGYLNAFAIEGAPSVAPDPSLNPVTSSSSSRMAISTANLIDEVKSIPSKVTVYPNPFVDDISLSMDLPQHVSKFTIMIVDISGRIVYQTEMSNAPKGIWNQRIGLNGRSLKSGIYFIRLIGLPNGISNNLKIVKP